MAEIPLHGHKRPWTKRASKGFKKDGSTFSPFKGSTSTGDARYSTAIWKRIRKAVLSEYPVCSICLDKDILKASAQVDHIEPHQDGTMEFHDITNLWGLCASCHAKKSAREGNGQRPPSGIDPRGWWIKKINKTKKL